MGVPGVGSYGAPFRYGSLHGPSTMIVGATSVEEAACGRSVGGGDVGTAVDVGVGVIRTVLDEPPHAAVSAASTAPTKRSERIALRLG